MDSNYSSIDLSKYRAELSTWNLQGKTICTVAVSNMDLLHNDKVKGDKLRLTVPLKKYEVLTEDIFATEVIPMKDGSDPMIQLNRNPDLIFKMGPCEFVIPTLQTVMDAIDQRESGSKIKFFQNLEELTKIVCALNREEKSKADTLIEELVGFSTAYEDLNKVFETKSRDYYKSLGLID